MGFLDRFGSLKKGQTPTNNVTRTKEIGKRVKGKGANTFRVRVMEVSGNTLKCSRENSGVIMKAVYDTEQYKIVPGQIVMTEYRKVGDEYTYVVTNDLIETVEANVLEAHHIISDGKMYTSLIIRNTFTGSRVHSLLDNNNKMFNSSSCIIKGDLLKIRFNNGVIFNIENLSEKCETAPDTDKA